MNWTNQLAVRLQHLAAREELDFQDTPQPLRDSYLRQHAVVEGCRKGEIAGLEREFGRFPAEYRDYLRTFGRRGLRARVLPDLDGIEALLSGQQPPHDSPPR